MGPKVPKRSDFTANAHFVVKDFDVPLAWTPEQGWQNWYGGRPRPYDVRALRVDNNWPPATFTEWQALIVASLPKKG